MYCSPNLFLGGGRGQVLHTITFWPDWLVFIELSHSKTVNSLTEKLMLINFKNIKREITLTYIMINLVSYMVCFEEMLLSKENIWYINENKTSRISMR